VPSGAGSGILGAEYCICTALKPDEGGKVQRDTLISIAQSELRYRRPDRGTDYNPGAYGGLQELHSPCRRAREPLERGPRAFPGAWLKLVYLAGRQANSRNQ